MQLRPILGIVTFLAMTSCVLAQTATGVIRGTVQDPTGAHLAAAKLTVTSVDTQASKVVETSDTGDYSVPYLINGTYTVKAEHAGFRPALTSNVVVRAAETVRVDFRMHLSEVQQVIDVSGTASGLQTDTTAVGTTIDSTSVRELPLNGRTFAQLAALVPGVAPQSSVNIATDRKRGSIGTSYAITANGFSDVQNSFVYDGVPAMDLDSYNFAFSPSIDAIAEFRVQTNSYSGAYGGAPGAHVDVVTKSGTNAFHGTLWEFNRNDALAARNYFSTTKARLNRNQFGANLGGPIRKNKAFFFFNWESGRQVQGTPGQLLSIPPVAFRAGDFSSLLPSGIIINDPTTGQPFLNNQIPATRIDPNATTFLSFTPAPNRSSDAQGANNFLTSNLSTRTTEDQYVGRVDYNVSSGDTMSTRYMYDELTTPNEAPLFGNDENINTARGQNLVIRWTHTFSPTFVSNISTGWNRFFEHQVFGTTNKRDYDIACGLMHLPKVACDPFNYGPPNVQAGYSVFSVRNNGPRDRMNQRWSVDVKTSVQIGRHLLDFGASAYRLNWTFEEVVYPRGVYRFDGTQTAPAGTVPTSVHRFADFLLGLAHALILSPTPLNVRENSWNTNLYFQDSWRLSDKLTVNLGMRWDLFQRPIQEGGRIANYFMDGPGGVIEPGPPKLYALPDPANGINGIIESDDGGILVAKDSGIIKLREGKAEVVPLPAGLQFKPGKLFRDRDGALWIGAVADSGLLHIHQGKTDLFTPAEGVFGDLSGDSVRCFLEDREGSIWVATRNGLDRFRDYAVPTISIQQGLSGHSLSAVLAAKDGSIWMGASNGLNQWRNGKVTVYRKRSLANARGGSPVYVLRAGMPAESRPVREIIDDGLPADSMDSLFEDSRGQIWVTTHSGVAILKSGRFYSVRSVPAGIVFSITEDRAGNVWMSHQEGLLHLVQARVVERVPWAKLGRREPAIALRHDPSEGGLWLGFGEGEVVYFKQGQLAATYAVGEGVGSLNIDAKGTLWAATTRGLARIKGGRALMLTSDNGLPCNTVHWMMEGDADSIWLYTACGLVRMAQSELDAWATNPRATIHATVFDSGDGVRSQQFHYGRSPIVAKAADGKLWFLPFADVSVIDPHHLPLNKLPPPVHVEQITADDRPYNATNGMWLPAGVHNLAIDYTALSLVAPEKVRFRYKLEGQNKNWHEVVNHRQLQYTNLGPGTYRFRVMACNNSGIWNEQGASLEFVIPPMWYQTNWFYALCAAAFLALLWAAYQLRVRQLAHQFNMRLEERVSERTRIARDLHDTLLQSFQALLPRLQAAIYKLPNNPADARKTLEETVDMASEAITEGRDAVQGLRMSTVEKNDLAQAIRTIGEELASSESNGSAPKFEVVVEGTSRNLHPILRDEVYRLAVEALRNAFRHAAAQHVEVEIHYDATNFRLRVRDDGKGIGDDVLRGEGREGHYGLSGMRERAALVGGKLTIWTELQSGTEIELIILASRAYAKPTRRFWASGKPAATDSDVKETIEHE